MTDNANSAKSECMMCGQEGLNLGDVEMLERKVFGRIPFSDLVKMWYKRGYKPSDIVCDECIEK